MVGFSGSKTLFLEAFSTDTIKTITDLIDLINPERRDKSLKAYALINFFLSRVIFAYQYSLSLFVVID